MIKTWQVKKYILHRNLRMIGIILLSLTMVQGINLSPKTFFRSDMERLKTGGVAKFDV